MSSLLYTWLIDYWWVSLLDCVLIFFAHHPSEHFLYWNLWFERFIFISTIILLRPSRPEPIFYFFCWVCLYSLDLNRSELHSIYITVIFFHAVLVPFFYSLAQCWNWYTNICTFIYSHMLYIMCNCLVALMINNRPNPGLEKFRRPAASRLDYIFPLCYSLLSSITSTTC